MRFEDLYRLLLEERYYVFSLEDLCTIWPAVKRSSMKQYLSRWNASGWIVRLRKGIYELAFPSTYSLSDMYVANRIYSPSYVSLETALSHYNLIPEVSMAVTSVTSKPTRKFKNLHGLFTYHTVRPKAYRGYRIEVHGGFDVLVAEPEKALVDYLHFARRDGREFSLEEDRLDRRRVSRLSKRRLKSYAQLYGLDLENLLYAQL